MTTQTKTTWRKVKLGEVAILNPPVHLEKGEKYPFVSMEQVEIGKKYISLSEIREYKGGGTKFRDGDILFARITPSLEHGKCGVVKLKGEKKVGFGSTEFFVFRGKENITYTDYLYYLSKTHELRQTAINSMVGVSGRQRARIDAIVNYEFHLPPLNEQKRIAEILSAFDEKIELNNKINQILEEMAQAIFKEWFVKFRFPGWQKVKFVDSELGKIPEGCKIRRISDFFDVKSGLAYRAESISENKPGKPIVTMGSIFLNSRFIAPKVKFFNGECTKKHLLKGGDIIIASHDVTQNKEFLGRPSIIPSNFREIIMGNNLFGLQNRTEIPNAFFYHILTAPHYRSYILGCAKGSNVLFLSKKAVENYKFVFPDKNVLNKFLNILLPISKRLEEIYIENQKLSALRDLLLPKLMSGEIRV